MTPLFATLFLDENVSLLVAELMQANGFEAITARQAARLGKSDPEQLAFATEHGYVMVTHNRVDFENLSVDLFQRGQHHTGIIFVTPRSPYEIARRLAHLLDNVTADEFYDNVRYI